MLTRRSFFAAAAGAVAGVAGVAAAAPVRGPAVVVPALDLATGPDRTAVWLAGDWDISVWLARGDQFEELVAPGNDLTREQYAANLPVIGRDALPADRKLPRACRPGAPARETQEQYRRRVGTKCPGMLE